ncbi:hypothetical protein BDC45DRAFT_101306 [Circinella umbellata]|nr:hypothetical protein BDC45DRAFT_101306 [Circinella umbellata]
MFGKISTASTTTNYPEKLDLKKEYVQTSLDSSDQDYYKKKLPPPISQDSVIPTIIAKNTKIDIVVSLDTLTKLLELHNNPSLEFDIPIVVRENEKGSKTLYMDQPLLQDQIETHEQNQIVYNMVFKSARVDWKSRHSLERNSTEIKDPEPTSHWNYKEDENIRYDLYTFGEQTILLRRQQDALLNGITSSNKQAYVSSVLDYSTDKKNIPIVEPLKSTFVRARYWLQSYVSGHGKVLEGKINVAKNELVAMRYLHMRDIMEKWSPAHESEYLRTLLLKLYKLVEPGHSYLLRKNKDVPLSIFQSTSEDKSNFDLYRAYPQQQEQQKEKEETTSLP